MSSHFLGVDWQLVADNHELLLGGLRYSLTLTASSMAFGIVLGCVLALMRLADNALLRNIAASYVNLFRSIPLVLVIFWFYFLLPFFGFKLGPDKSVFITFAIFEAAYYCEIIRAGIQSISRGQVGAAQALGLTYAQSMRYVILPQALRNMLPLLLLQTLVLFQDTSLVTIIGIKDFMGSNVVVASNNGALKEMYTFAALGYFCVCFPLSMALKKLHKRIAVIR
ncbi:L-glutamate ABC transporter membrane protein/L-aspartate ABC transporter membrane protein [Andreprevotia lacus DSM 23236]|jgi:glutamate/aspartate transport system permease protein|uniref:Glutamate/aspartate import permease protein GltK n=1 Tax=Andreprevotia lacus DSM 23236 TaxID=1121001 RepID=A0A1W1Y021_9NEIS|nr:amino acid ABC transporter permease [Andreprevotia lacus]SMC29560.1 L-glutamate ABC transporter membrane protein/L-aspartate ABC transporter membrane protein [Andreprevotia lacus DSM 23236]